MEARGTVRVGGLGFGGGWIKFRVRVRSRGLGWV